MQELPWLGFPRFFCNSYGSLCHVRSQDWSVSPTCLSWVTPSPVISRRWNGMPLPKHPGGGTQGFSELLSANHPCPGRTAMTPLNEVWPLQMTFLSHLLADQGTSRLVWSRSVCTSLSQAGGCQDPAGLNASFGALEIPLSLPTC